MIRTLLALVLTTVTCVSSAGWFTPTDAVDINKFQPEVTTTEVPVDIRGWNPDIPMMRAKLEPLKALVPTYLGDAKLIASWNPQPVAKSRPTIIFLHGGHGLSSQDMENARWAFHEQGFNALVLDSYWSRGITENWKTQTRYGANMRMLDLIAAARFVRAEIGVESPIFAVGQSQGGWTVLRTLTESNPANEEVRQLITGGIALYPNCEDHEYGRDDFKPILGTKYTKPLVVMTGGLDEATSIRSCDKKRVFKTATKWIHFEDATHGWDTVNNGVGRTQIDGKCARAQNTYNRFPVCFNKAATDATRKEIVEFVVELSKVAK